METNLIAAARQRDLGLLKKLLSEGANVNQPDDQGWTALHWSAGTGDCEVVRLLLDHHADITARGHDNRTAWMVARAAGRNDVMELLVQSEKAAGVWQDPRERRPYCKGFYLKSLRDFSQWPQDNLTADGIVYLHQDFTVTRSVWPGQDVLFSDVTPEWIQYCQSQLKFSISADIM